MIVEVRSSYLWSLYNIMLVGVKFVNIWTIFLKISYGLQKTILSEVHWMLLLLCLGEKSFNTKLISAIM